MSWWQNICHCSVGEQERPETWFKLTKPTKKLTFTFPKLPLPRTFKYSKSSYWYFLITGDLMEGTWDVDNARGGTGGLELLMCVGTTPLLTGDVVLGLSSGSGGRGLVLKFGVDILLSLLPSLGLGLGLAPPWDWIHFSVIQNVERACVCCMCLRVCVCEI